MGRKQLFTLIFFFSGIVLNAQFIWFDAGLKGSWGPTFLINENTLSENYLEQRLNTGYAFGGKFGINFGFHNGITFDLMYSNGRQKYRDLQNFGNDIDVNWKTYDLYVLYRMYRTISYLEIGPKFSQVHNFYNNNTVTNQYYIKSYPSAVLGFGWYAFGKKTFTGTIGFRIEYAFNDLINKEGQDIGYPVNPYRTTRYDNYKTTNPLIAQLVFEMNFGIGYFATTACGGRRHFFSWN